MNEDIIQVKTKNKTVYIKNRWELLSRAEFTHLVALIALYAAKKISKSDLLLFYVCANLHVDLFKIKDEEGVNNLIIISEQIDFIFDKDDNLNICFLAQLLPKVPMGAKNITGYTVNTDYNTLTCSLTAAQFVDAWEIIKSKSDKLPLLASILYSEHPYSSAKAHEQAKAFEKLPYVILQAISFNFQALVNFLFTKTHFSLLSSGKTNDIPEISTGMQETMYNLSADGMGDVNSVKQMPVVEFLTILRKKLIESVQAMHKSGIDMLKIIENTGLNSQTIKKML